jgi:hypothetical protein
MKQFVIKPSQAIHMSNVVSILQRKSWNIFLAHAYPYLEHEDIFTIDLDVFLRQVGITRGNDGKNSRNLMYIKDIIEELNGNIVKWNVLGKDKNKKWTTKKYKAMPLLAGTEVDVENNTISYSYSPILKKEIIKPAMYAKLLL